MAKLPRVLRVARSRTYGYQNPQRAVDLINRGYQGPDQRPDAMRGGMPLFDTGMHSSVTVSTRDQIERMARPALGRR